MCARRLDEELAEYQKRIGCEEYRKQYKRLYEKTSKHIGRFSGLKYENSPEKLKQIKEKYKNGISKETINEMLGIKEEKEK